MRGAFTVSGNLRRCERTPLLWRGEKGIDYLLKAHTFFGNKNLTAVSVVGMHSFNEDIAQCEPLANLSSLVEPLLIHGLDVEPLC